MNELLTDSPGARAVPAIPENAPFTPEQRAWLNGFLAGLFSRAPLPGQTNPTALQPLTILFGSQTGNAELLAKRVAKIAGQRGFAPTIADMGQYERARLTQEKNLLLVTSTYGDGEPPDNAKSFWEFLAGDGVPELSGLRFSVCALGDTNYAKFCQCGRDFDRRLSELKSERVFARADCNIDFEEPFSKWVDGALAALAGTPKALAIPLSAGGQAAISVELAEERPARCYSRFNPFSARLVTNRLLNGPRSTKETRHFEISLEGSGIAYEAGDALGVFPTNCSALVDEIIQALRCDAETPVPAKQMTVPLRKALLEHYDLARIQKSLIEYFAQRAGDELLKKLVAPDVNGEFETFLQGRHVVDLLLGYPQVTIAPEEFVPLLRPLQPRLYSISSSPKVHLPQVHLTVSTVRYESLGRARKGVCSTFLADRTHPEMPVNVFVQANKTFRLPDDSDRPIIMIGPGTGIAPFRAFLYERQATGARGKSWLFFGDQREGSDFLYRQELEALVREGTLTRLDTAFSRDQEEKIYVQHRLREHAPEFLAWLEEGAYIYVCGDATRMAKDVDAALHRVIEIGGGRTLEESAEYVRQLAAQRRYQRDVY